MDQKKKILEENFEKVDFECRQTTTKVCKIVQHVESIYNWDNAWMKVSGLILNSGFLG